MVCEIENVDCMVKVVHPPPGLAADDIHCRRCGTVAVEDIIDRRMMPVADPVAERFSMVCYCGIVRHAERDVYADALWRQRNAMLIGVAA